jgi:hypothetical protein
MRWFIVAFSFGLAEALPCGTIPGAANFGLNGDELRDAVSCVVLGTKCDSSLLAEDAKGSAASVEAYYGPIEDFCTGAVVNFNVVFQNMPVSLRAI